MKELFESIYQDIIVHHTFLDKKAVLECMRKAYYAGKNEEKEKIKEFKKTVDSLLDDLRK